MSAAAAAVTAAGVARLPSHIPLDELRANLSDPHWRLGNLYTIVNDASQAIAFVPNAEQWQLVRGLHNRNIILKARQMGFTTAAGVIAVDQAIFNRNFQAVIIAHALPDAQRIFRKKVLDVYEALPELARRVAPIKACSASELLLENGSSIVVSTSARGGTTNMLHVSEMGKIALRNPLKASEIVSGAFESVPLDGQIVVESTAEGRRGWFYKSVMECIKAQKTGRAVTQLDFKLHFYPWWKKVGYALPPEGVLIDDKARVYFAKLKAEGIDLTPAQRAWYVVKKRTLGDMIYAEYPATEAEAFMVSVDGLILAEQMKHLRMLGRIGPAPLRADLPVNTFWDFGVNDHNVMWLHQRVGATNRFVGFFQDHNKGLAHYWKLLEGWRVTHGARWGRHFLPHDANTRLQGAELFTRRQVLVGLGMDDESITVVPRVADLVSGIQLLKQFLPDVEIDEEACAEGIESLDSYTWEWDESAGDWKREPRHDKASHGVDGMRQAAQAFAAGDALSRRSGGMPEIDSNPWSRGGY